MNFRIFCCVLLLLPLIGTVQANDGAKTNPAVFWVSSPVRPNETVLLHGANFLSGPAPVTAVSLVQGDKKETVCLLHVTDTSIAFVFPADFSDSAATEGFLLSKSGQSASFKVNAPAIWWIQGDLGRVASTKNGRIWLAGNVLTVPQTDKTSGAPVSVRLIALLKENPTFGKPVSAEIIRQSSYGIEVKVPVGLPEGEYNIGYCRSQGESELVSVGRIKLVNPTTIYRPEVFDIGSFGAIPNDGMDDTDAILAALEKLTANGGGTLFVPRGRFQMTKTIELPPNSRLTGLGDASQIYWPDAYEPVEALVKGTHSFEVSRLFLTCGNHKDGIVGNGPLPQTSLSDEEKANYRSGNITVRNVTLRQIYSQYLNDAPGEMIRRLKPIHYARALRFGGENIVVEDNNIYCAAGGVFELRCYWSRIQNNRFCRGNIVGWNGFCGQQLLFTDNWLGGANCTSFYGLPEGSENILWARNYHENNFDGNNRETITGDGRVHGYMDTVENITAESFTLKKSVPLARDLDLWQTGAVQIAGGKGVGQIRRIRSIAPDSANQDVLKCTLESPWDVLPDAQSVLNISSFRRRFIYADNEAYDATVALQLYGSMIEGLMIHNKTARTGGYNADAMSGEANWFNQLLENEIEAGNSYRGPRNEVPAENAQIGLLAYGNGTGDYKYPLVRACVARNNKLRDNAKLNVQGTVVESLLEGNLVANTEAGIVVSSSASEIILRGNQFQNVERPYVCEDQSVCLDTVERFNAGLASAVVLLKKSGREIPDGWPTDGAKTADQIEAVRLKAIRSLSTGPQGQTADVQVPVSAEIAEFLTGLKIQFPNWATTYWTIRDGKAGTCWLLPRPYFCTLKAHLKITVPEDWFPLASEQGGWKFVFPEYDLIPGETSRDENAQITKPSGVTRLLRFPLKAELTGTGSDGKPWSLTFQQTIFDPHDSIPLEGFRVSRPLNNPLNRVQGVSQKLGYIPYSQIPKPNDADLVAAPTEFGRFAFVSLYEPIETAKETAETAETAGAAKKPIPENPDAQLIYGVSVLNVSAATKVKIRFGGNFLLYVNGEIVGTTLQRGQWGFACLNEGENRIEFLTLPTGREEFRGTIPSILWADRPELLFSP